MKILLSAIAVLAILGGAIWQFQDRRATTTRTPIELATPTAKDPAIPDETPQAPVDEWFRAYCPDNDMPCNSPKAQEARFRAQHSESEIAAILSDLEKWADARGANAISNNWSDIDYDSYSTETLTQLAESGDLTAKYRVAAKMLGEENNEEIAIEQLYEVAAAGYSDVFNTLQGYYQYKASITEDETEKSGFQRERLINLLTGDLAHDTNSAATIFLHEQSLSALFEKERIEICQAARARLTSLSATRQQPSNSNAAFEPPPVDFRPKLEITCRY